MGCENCSSNGVPAGCRNNGACSTGGCSKLAVYDWLANVELPNGQSTYDIVEVRFKNSRKGFYRNMKGYNLQVGDAVVVEASPGYDVGVVSVSGELARIQVRKKAPNFKPHEARQIKRIASSDDIEKWKTSSNMEKDAMYRSRKLASELALDMKISDVEYQGDGNKATFYYTAEDRVDFRQLIKDMADEFKIRIEMKQIGVRQEAARLGGIGSCGRELCCATWLTDFRSVSTASARYQQLSLNPQKLAGQCGKLKCCLNYELDAYLEALKKFPGTDVKLKTQKGIAFHIKTDVFKEEMWYLFEESESGIPGTLVPLSPERVKEIIKMNKEGKKPNDLKDFVVEKEEVAPDYTNVVGQDSLNRFEHVFKRKKKKKKGKNQGGLSNRSGQGQQKQAGQGNKSEGQQKQSGQNNRTEGQKKNKSGQNNRNQQGKKGGNNNPQNSNQKNTGGSNKKRRPNKNNNRQKNEPKKD